MGWGTCLRRSHANVSDAMSQVDYISGVANWCSTDVYLAGTVFKFLKLVANILIWAISYKNSDFWLLLENQHGHTGSTTISRRTYTGAHFFSSFLLSLAWPFWPFMLETSVVGAAKREQLILKASERVGEVFSDRVTSQMPSWQPEWEVVVALWGCGREGGVRWVSYMLEDKLYLGLALQHSKCESWTRIPGQVSQQKDENWTGLRTEVRCEGLCVKYEWCHLRARDLVEMQILIRRGRDPAFLTRSWSLGYTLSCWGPEHGLQSSGPWVRSGLGNKLFWVA